jgi:hypothetical protein
MRRQSLVYGLANVAQLVFLSVYCRYCYVRGVAAAYDGITYWQWRWSSKLLPEFGWYHGQTFWF